MSVININSLQNKNGLVSNYTDEYILQALANLGQRTALKGDSVIVKTITLRDVYTVNTDEFSADTHIGCISRENENIVFKILNKETFVNVHNDAIEYVNTFVNNTKITLPADQTINSITEYEAGYLGVIQQFPSKICTLFCGDGPVEQPDKTFVNELKEIVFLDVNKSNGVLNKGIRFWNYENKVRCVVINQTDATYYADCYIIESTKTTSAKEVLEEIRQYLNNEICPENSTVPENIFDYLTKYISLGELQTSGVIFKKINKNDLGKYVEMQIHNIDGNFKFKSNKRLVDHDIFQNGLEMFISDVKIFYPFIKEYYSTNVFLSSNESFKQQIFASLYEKISEDSGITLNNKLYFDLDFQIECLANSNEEWKLYGSTNDINVKFTDADISRYSIDRYLDKDNILSNTLFNPRNSLYSFATEFDGTNNEIVFGINVNKKYTMPYINNDKYWVIDEKTTDVKAEGLDAGNPNIVILYSKSKFDGDYKILAGANKDNVLKNLTYSLKQFWVEPLERINLDDASIVTRADLLSMRCWIPNLQNLTAEKRKETIEALKYSIIISVSSTTCFENISDDMLERYGEYGVVTSFWTFNEDNCEFEVILKETPFGNNQYCAMDINSLTNLNNMIKWNIKNIELKNPDRYTHNWLVFEQSYVTLKNNTADETHKIYPNMGNINAIDFNKAQYNNDLNFVLRYSESVLGADENNIRKINNSQQFKYFTFTNNLIPVTDAIYTYRDINNIPYSYNEYIPNQNVPMFNLKEMLVQNMNVINRTNILSFDKFGTTYYSYIGATRNTDNKNELHIGTDNLNINIGTDSLIQSDSIGKFTKQNELHIDFPTTYISNVAYVNEIGVQALENIYYHKDNWKVNSAATGKQTSVVVNSTTITPSSQFISQCDEKYSIDGYYLTTSDLGYPVQLNNKLLANPQMKNLQVLAEHILNSSDKFEFTQNYWVPLMFTFNGEQKEINNLQYIYLGDGLFIPALLETLQLTKRHIGRDVDYYNDIVITSNCKIISYETKEYLTTKHTPLLLVTNNRHLTGVNANVLVGNDIIQFEYSSLGDEIFIGNDLQIRHYIKNNVLYVQINEINTNAPKIKHLYPFETIYPISFELNLTKNIKSNENIEVTRQAPLNNNFQTQYY
jgi:hypothetical protein